MSPSHVLRSFFAWIALTTALFILVGCTIPQIEAPPDEIATSESVPHEHVPKVIHHPAITVRGNPAAYQKCFLDSANDEGTENTDADRISDLDCTYTLWGLTPDYPVAMCWTPIGEDNGDASLFWGCYEYVLVACIDGEPRFLQGAQDIQEIFAPIESAAEAVTYAQVIHGMKLFPIYGFDLSKDEEYFVDEIEDSFVTETDDGYRVHLFTLEGGEPCTCGSIRTFTLDVLVRRDGTVSVGPETLISDTIGEACYD